MGDGEDSIWRRFCYLERFCYRLVFKVLVSTLARTCSFIRIHVLEDLASQIIYGQSNCAIPLEYDLVGGHHTISSQSSFCPRCFCLSIQHKFRGSSNLISFLKEGLVSSASLTTFPTSVPSLSPKNGRSRKLWWYFCLNIRFHHSYRWIDWLLQSELLRFVRPLIPPLIPDL